jgi:hypothetical protein
MNWTQLEAIELCARIERQAPKAGCHVALTGGCLYKDGERKDLDILFYRIRQWDQIDKETLFGILEEDFGIVVTSGFGWCHKSQTKEGKKLDLFFPEEDRMADEPDYPLDATPSRSDEQLSGTDRNMPGKPNQNNLAAEPLLV